MRIKIETLAPIWTGGVQPGKMNRIQETGIIGGLRWWYEAILRGLGGKICDPSRHECLFDKEKFEKAEGKGHRERLSEAGLCDACQLFGATGYRRRFQVRVANKMLPAWNAPPKNLEVQPPGRSGGWRLPLGHVGETVLRFAGTDDALNRLANLFLFLEKWGTLGAKPQLGYGAFEIDPEDRKRLLEQAAPFDPAGENAEPPGNLPDLRRMAFFRFRFTPSGTGWWSNVPGLERLLGRGDTSRALSALASLNMIPVAPALKNVWRYGFEERISAEREVFGTIQHDRIRSKIAVSWAYKTGNSWQVRGWVWLPPSLPKPTRETILKRIRDKSIWMDVLKTPTGDLTVIPGSDALKNPWKGIDP
jgi:CRISPR-associated protein Cmr1